ncbi:E3 ubiquitin-protein ligase highwire [Anopheles cruzii]|uniref:E3 ubiquitin-protein ligase highwire n=1 Tax=Anopheles cruzii TaxID=68878 RepID=UPI0022EC1AD6|nr:E3 ubiquitin-protein ligase highwire [Anopheles cruzii]
MELYDSARYGSVFGNIFLSTEASDPGDGGPGPAGPKKDSKAALLLEPTLDRYEVAANASRFAVYHAVRSIVLERETTTRRTVASMRIIDTALDEPKSIGSSSAQAGAGSRVPQIVLAGLDSLYGIIAETRHSQPRIATKALRSLYDILQGQVPEGMRHEPDAVFGPLFDLLLELATTTSPSSTAPGAWSSLACSTLLSLAIAKGDTGRIVRAVAAILMSSAHGSATGGSFNAGGTGTPASGCVQMPQSVAKLQRTVFSMATGRATIADYFRCGIPRGCLIGEFRLPLESSTVYSVASDGKFLYLVTAKGVLKIGSGFSGTQEGLIYGAVTIAMAKNELPGWIGYAGGKLYYGRISKGNVNNGWTFQLYDPTTLTALGTVQTAPIPMLQRRFGQLFSDGDAICWLGAVSDSLRDGPEVEDQEEDILVVKQLYPPAPSAQPGSIPGASDVRPELRLKLAKNRYHTYGWAAFEEELGENSATAVGAGVPGAGPHSTTVVSPPILDGGNPQQGGSIQSISCGKEFGLVLVEDGSVSGGKVFYWGRSTALGLKLSVNMAGASGCVMGAPKATVTMKLTELTALPKGISYFRQVAVGHEANHGLLLTNDGTVYFTGTAKRGEDGELAKTNRRQPKAIKPKRLNKLDGHSVTFVACNNGTSAFVTKEGKLIMYGKDANYCEPNGVVGGLADVVIRKVALGKAHCVAVDALGQLYTFGLNNKGQCGRKFQRERNADETVTANNPSVITNGQPSSVPPSTGSTCNACHAVTMAPSTLEPPATATPAATAATKCGCGCGCCCHCGGNGSDRNAPNTVAPLSSNDADTPRIVPVPPQRVDLPHSGPDSRRAPIVTQIACGQHHSLVLTSSGEVFSFGSNQYGQLGTGDLQAPAGGRPHLIRFPSGTGTAVSVAAGSNHSVVLSSRGAVFTFGNYHKGQLGREAPDAGLVGGTDSSSNFFWHCAPAVIDSFGPGTGRRASWIAASGDQTYIKVEESLINGAALAKYSVTADRSTILLIPSNQPHLAGSITIDRRTGHCRAHRTNQFDARLELNGGPQPVLKEMYRRARWHFSFTLDPLFNVLWGYDAIRKRMLIFNPIAAELYRADRNEAGGSARFGLGSATEPLTVLSPEIALPQRWQGCEVPRFQLALNLLACLDVLTEATERLGASGQWPPFEPGTGLDGGPSAAAGSNASPLDGNVNVNASEWFTGTRGVFCGSSSGRQVKLCDVPGDDEPQEEELPEQSNQRSALLTPTFGSIDEEPSAIAPSNRWNLPPSEGVHAGEGRFPFRSGRSKTPASGALNAGVQYRRKKSSLGSGGSSATGSTAGGGAAGMFQSSSNVDESVVSLCPISRRFATGINRETLESLTELLGWAWNAFRNLSGDQKKGSRNSGSAANPGLSANGLFGEAKLIVRLSFVCRACLRLLRRYLNAIYHPTGSRGTGTDELDGGCSDGHSVDDPLGRSSDLAAAPSFGSQQHHATSYSPMSSSAFQLPTAATTNHQSLAVAVIEIRTLLIDILADRGATAAPLVDRSMRRRIGRAKREVLAECHRTFVRCFDIFYPTPPLKWEILCRRFSSSGGGSPGGRLLLSAILAGLCQPSVNLRVTFSILSATPSSSSVSSSRPASGSSGAMLAIARNRDLLASLIEQMTSGGTTAGSVEGSVGPAQPHLPDWHFRDVLELLLELVSDPVRRKLDRIGRHRRRACDSDADEDDSEQDEDEQQLQQQDDDDEQSQERLLIRNGCRLLAKLLSEIIHHGCDPIEQQQRGAGSDRGGDHHRGGDREEETTQTAAASDLMVPPGLLAGSNRLYSTGSRFGKIDLGKTWNTGNFGPDAIAFTVDRGGISIAGACVYSGSGSYEYQLELLYDSHHSTHAHSYSHSHRWEVLESIVGSYDQTAVRQHVAELRFNRAVLLKENHRYALRLCSQGARTLSGDCGQSSLRGPCGTVTFRFYPCDLSFNGTTPARGQIPAILYYSTPGGAAGPGSFQLGGAAAPVAGGGRAGELGNGRTQARDLALEVARAIVGRCRELLTVAHELALWTSASGGGLRAPSSTETSSTPSSSASSGVVGIVGGGVLGGPAAATAAGGGVAIDSEHNITPIEEHLDVGSLSTTTGLVSVIASNAASTTIERTRRTIGKVLPKGLLETLRGASGTGPSAAPYDPYEIDSASEATPAAGPVPIGGPGGGMLANGNEMELPAGGGAGGVVMATPIRKRTVWDLFRSRTTRCPSVVNCLFRYLLPLTLAQLERCIRMDLKVAVEVLSMVQEILPPITALNELRRQQQPSSGHPAALKTVSSIGATTITSSATSTNTTSQHYCILESDHPYRTAGITAYRVRFPSSVRWMCLSFDAQCGTVQEEDRVKVKIPNRGGPERDKDGSPSCAVDDWVTVRMYNTPSRWSYGGPGRSMVLPGREVEISLESCSTYVAEPKHPAYGFRCLVIGYENPVMMHPDHQHPVTAGGTLIALEQELAHLGGRCSRNLLRKELRFDDDPDDRLTEPEVATLERYGGSLLAKGLMVPDAMLTIRNALDCHLPVLEKNYEKQFLRDFIYVAAGSPGARLAAWLQPESRLDPSRCEIKIISPQSPPLRAGWPSHFRLETRDQYGEEIFVPGIKIEVKASLRRDTSVSALTPKVSPGTPTTAAPPTIPYEPTYKEKEKSCLQAISAMRPYHGYSFEELRLYAANMSSTSPSTAATTEILTANDLGKNKYGFVWTPMVAGAYELTLQIDGTPVVVEDEEEIYRLEVIDAGGAAGAGVGTGGGGAGGSGVSGVTPKMLSGEKGAPGGAGQGLKKVHPPTKLRKFLAKNSAGLRVRLHPTLQSEQIGVVRPNGIVAYGDELENDDGVWVRLTAESIREHCPASWFPVEAWCLQYNQHLGKTLLHPIVDPCSTKALLEHTAAKEEPAVAAGDDAEDIEADDCEAEEEEDGEENENTINYGDFRKVASAALSEVVGGGAKALQKWFHRTGTDGTGPLLDEQPSSKPVLLPATPLNQPQSVAQQQQQQEQQSSQHLPKRALSPSVAETLRAVFAAFLWHEGLVHDAMACASFLKFHPTISKTAGIGGPLAGANGSLGIGGSQPAPEPTTALTREQKVLQRHSVELSNATLDALERSGNRCIINRRHRGGPFSFVEAAGAGGSSGAGPGAGSAAVPPVALRCLVHLWDQLGSNFVQLVETNSNDKRNDDGQGPKEFPPTTATGPGSTGAGGTAGALVASKSGVTLAASAATGAGGVTQPSSTAAPTNGGSGPADGSYCELCRTVLHSIPVTYHMRLAHPGCGRPAGGQGYNSNGVYCEGWAGDCGDGGHGVSSWYLLCDGCRKRYEGTTPVPLPVPALGMGPDHRRTTEPPRSTLPSELFAMMKENAFFLLDLAPVEQSASGGGSAGTSSAGAEGSLTEVTDASEWPTPPERPACLGTFIDTADMAGQATTTAAAPSSAGRFPADHGFPLGMPGGKFHRSVSMGQGAVGPSVVLRRRQRRDDERSEANLLNHPSENLRRLVPLDGTPYHGPVTASDGTVGLLARPAMVFILERHNLERMRRLLIRQLRRSLCHRYSLQAFNWLLRQLTEPIGLHDVMWWFVSALTASDADTSDPGPGPDVESELGGLEHPASTCEGHLGRGISRALHAYLSTVSELTLHFPLGSPLQRIAVQCFGLRFVPSDHQFLHRVNVFGNISRILSKSEEEEERALEAQSVVRPSGLAGYPGDDGAIDVTLFQDVTDAYELTVSSRPALAPALLDSSTETFWESDEEDRGKPKTIELVPGGRAGGGGSGCHLTLIAIHVDNSRDVACKVTSLLLYGGSPSHSPAAGGELSLLRTIDIDPAACAWQAIPVTSVGVAAPSAGHYRLEVRGPDATLRIRQVKLYGTRTDNLTTSEAQSHAPSPSPRQVQSRLCEQETLRVFRLLTGQVFGKLLEETSTLLGSNGTTTNGAGAPAGNGGAAGEVAGGPELSPLPSLSESIHDLREHAVGILFSRRKLSHLQKQIIVHVVQAIERETVKARDAWEAALNEDTSGGGVTTTIYNDAYCFEMLSMVLALSGSSVGRTYLSQQHHLLKDLLSLAHTGSDRVQRQVMALIRRILPELPSDTHLTETGASPNPSSDSDSEALLDVLLALIAKSLQVQVKVKNGANGQHQTVPQNVPPAAVAAAPAVVSLANVTPFAPSQAATGNGSGNRHQQRYRWYLRGSIAAKQAESIIALVRDMASGKLLERWATVSRAAVASCLLSVTQLDEDFRRSADACIRTATLWLAMAALCVIDKEQIGRLSTNQWHRQSESNRPLCSNHDDDVTFAVLNCALCGSLCADCDRVLHLNRRTRNHHRTVCKEEQDAIRVELHESCGRAKLYWLWAVVDSRTLKGMLEFRGHDPSASCAPVPVTATGVGVCRFCGTTGSSGLLALGNICPDAQCQEYGAVSCTKVHSRCGHACGGIINEMHCLPCLVPNCQSDGTVEPGVPRLTQDGEDMCMICFTETLGTAPSLQLRCGHVFHYHCCKTVLMRRWNGPRISFGFAQCPICKVDIEHPSLELFLAPIVALRQDVKRKALMRLEYEGLAKAVTADGTDPTRYAMERYAYYVCSQCGKAYYGGEARCDAELGENFNPQELVCGGCSDVSKAKMCPKHGMDFLEYKCRYCCSVAVFFCFGTTHFCDTCHDDFQRLTNLPKGKLPRCPAGPKASQLAGEECPLHVVHPPTGEEFALGCGICRNAQTF